MRYAHTALLSAAATCLLAFATPAIAEVSSPELGHPSGCARCGGGVYSTAPTQGYDYGGVPVIGPVLGIGIPPAAAALAPETRAAATSKMRHAKHRFTAVPAEVRGAGSLAPPSMTAPTLADPPTAQIKA
jgi:hypothetical protein